MSSRRKSRDPEALRREVLGPDETRGVRSVAGFSWLFSAALVIVLVAGAVDAALWRLGTERDDLHRELRDAQGEIRQLERELDTCRMHGAPAELEEIRATEDRLCDGRDCGDYPHGPPGSRPGPSTAAPVTPAPCAPTDPLCGR